MTLTARPTHARSTRTDSIDTRPAGFAERPVSWLEPVGPAPRGTVVLVPGRGEPTDVYERLGRRLTADAYRVHVVADPTVDLDRTVAQLTAFLDDPSTVGPTVLAGSDTGALVAIDVAAARAGSTAGIDALLLAGLPTGSDRPDHELSWEEELDARTSCPTHRNRLTVADVRRGVLSAGPPAGWGDADLASVGVPVLALHGRDDPISDFATARERYASAPSVDLVAIEGGRHDVLNDQTHRTVAATIVLFLERLRLGGGAAPLAVHVTPHTGEERPRD